MRSSLFVHGDIVAPNQFYNRRREVRRLLSRLVQGGSTAIIGQPHTGKTSLLSYIQEPEIQQRFTGNSLERCLLRFLDVQMLGGIEQPAFWQQALEPLITQFPAGPVHDLYIVSKKNKFGTFTLEKLFAALQAEGWRLALLLDEFDSFLNHPKLNNVEFYGSLRSLSSRYNSLALVITTRRSLDFLNQSTQELNPHGSPYFNIFNEIRLGSLPKKDAADLLAQAGDVFGRHDRQFLFDVSGRQPYLLQLAADCLWHVHHEGERGNRRYEKAANELYDQARLHLGDTWRKWSEAERKVVTAVALNEIPYLAAGREFQEGRLIQDINDYSPELRGLEKSDTISQNNAGVWLLNQEVLLWWLAEEIKRATRDDANFTEWLQRHQLDGLFTNQERQRWGQAAQTVTGTLGKGVTTLIESFSKGFGEGVGKAAAGKL